MSEKTRIVRLSKNESYPTYQLFAVMAKKTPVQKGLRIGVRTVLDWLLSRLGEGAPEELSALAGQEEPLFSYHVSCGYGIDIVYIPEQGTWTLQITEPDLGSEPGNPDQERPPVPGRVITSNVGFCIQGERLECGFQILMSDPEHAREDAPVYRLAPVRRLMQLVKAGAAVTAHQRRARELIFAAQTGRFGHGLAGSASRRGVQLLVRRFRDGLRVLVVFHDAFSFRFSRSCKPFPLIDTRLFSPRQCFFLPEDRRPSPFPSVRRSDRFCASEASARVPLIVRSYGAIPRAERAHRRRHAVRGRGG